MSSLSNGGARAVADLAAGHILASVEIAAPPREARANTCMGWETSFERLADVLAREREMRDE